MDVADKVQSELRDRVATEFVRLADHPLESFAMRVAALLDHEKVPAVLTKEVARAALRQAILRGNSAKRLCKDLNRIKPI